MNSQSGNSMRSMPVNIGHAVPAGTLGRGGVKRPAWVSAGVHQRVVLVLDASPSMAGEKAREASDAALAFVRELAEPVNKGGFDVAVIQFAGRAKVTENFRPASDLASRMGKIEVRGFRTNIAKALALAEEVMEGARTEDGEVRQIRPAVFLMTDGAHNGWSNPDVVAERVKAKADVITVAFGMDADEVALRRWATSPQHFYRVTDGRELRNLLAAAGATLTKTMAAGGSATRALAGLRRQ